MTLIDLGEVHDDVAPSSPSSRPPRSVGRPLRVGLVVVLLLGVLAAAAPPAKPVRAVVPGTAGAQTFLTEDTLYVVEPPAGGGHITAYPLPRRATARPRLPPRWQVPVPGSPFWITPAPDGSVLVSVQSAGTPGSGRSPWTARRGGSGGGSPVSPASTPSGRC